MTNELAALIARAEAAEAAHQAAMKVWKAERVGAMPVKAQTREAATINGRAFEVRATTGGNGKMRHVRVTFMVDGKRASAAEAAAIAA